MALTDVKGILQSKTFWGALVSLLAMFAPTIFGWFGIEIDPTGQAMLVDKIIAAIGFVYTVYGRIVATKQVTLVGS